MRAVLRKAAVLSLSFALGCGALAGCGNSAAKIDGSQVLMTVNGEDVRLGVGSFYAKYEQASIYQIYSMYFGQTTGIFDSAHDHDGGQETYGDEMKESVISDLKKMMTIKQHADEYGVSLTDEQKKAIDEAAQAYIDGNDESVRAKIGADKEDVVTLMTLQSLQAAMMDPIVKDVDTEISDEEAQQTSLTYVKVDVQSEAESAESAAESLAAESAGSAAESAAAESTASTSESAAAESTASAAESAAAESSESAAESSSAESAESAAESAAAESTESAAESAAAESTESTEGSAEETAAQTEAREAAEAIIAEAMLEEDIASADLDAIAKTVDENYYTQTGHFTKAAPESATLDANLVEAVKDLEDGQLVDHAVQSADGTAYYVARLDHVVDEDATESEKSSILTSRKQTLYDDTVNGWVDEAQITVNDAAWAKVTLTDSDPVTLKTPPVESTASEAESTASSGTESASESAASAAESAVSGAESTAVSAAESAVSGAESAAVSAAESTVSTAVSAAESAVSAAESAANTAASTAKPAAGTAASTAVSAAESAASSVKSAS